MVILVKESIREEMRLRGMPMEISLCETSTIRLLHMHLVRNLDFLIIEINETKVDGAWIAVDMEVCLIIVICVVRVTDKVFGSYSETQEVYEVAAGPVIKAAMEA